MSKIEASNISSCIETLRTLLSDTTLLAELPEQERVELLKLSGQLSRPDRNEYRARNKKLEKQTRQRVIMQERAVRAKTGIREARQNTVFSSPAQLTHSSTAFVGEMNSARNCYVCKAEYTKLHFFYDSMCPECAQFNYDKRFQRTDMRGQTALITGARLKIGYYAAIMMLESGAKVIVTTRFPVDAAVRFAKEKGYADWCDRLQIHGLDLRHTPSVEIFAKYIEQTEPRLDILINNAAQTVRRPPGFYAHLIATESLAYHDLSQDVQKILKNYEDLKEELNALCAPTTTSEKALPVAWHQGSGPGVGLRASAQLSQIPYSYDSSLTAAEVFPEGKLDADLQQVDLRTTNSWRYKLADVPAPEMLEVQLVNAVAPFILCSKLAPLMRRDNTGKKHIVNVTAMEGKFYRFTKADRHPHTNMAKAALNMMTHTSASDLAKDGIYMNAVDTGWVTDEDPMNISLKKQDVHDFQPPLDIVDGAARICDPFIDGINTGTHWCGKFLKDYRPIDW